MKKRKIIALCGLLLAGALALSGCGEAAVSSEGDDSDRSVVSSAEREVESEVSSTDETSSTEAETADAFALGDQLELPEIGEEICVIETTQGTIKMRLFPEQAPKTVENFKQIAQDGLYDGLSFHRIIDDFMIQTGQTNSTAINGGYLEDEFSETLLNLRGAVSMANTGYANTATTQFFINQTTAEAFEEKGGWEQILNGYRTYLQSPTVFTQYYGSWCDMSKIGMDIRELYETYGGTPSLDGAYTTTGTGYTVFGQVFEGMDVVDKIAAAETDDNDAPVNEDDYKVISVTFETYEG